MSPQNANGAGQAAPLRLYRGAAPRAVAPCVLTIGSFDGLHVGI